jgi:DNA-binding NtrC family response regulator
MGTAKYILVVDDDHHVLEVIDARLTSAGFEVHRAEGGAQALQILGTQRVDVMVSDVKMPEMGGMQLLTEARRMHPQLPVILLTAYGTIPDAVEAVKSGAVDYLTKPFDGQELIRKLKRIQVSVSALNEKEPEAATTSPEEVNSAAMKQLYDLVGRVAASDVNVLILGESGVGKERIARLIHQVSRRCAEPFVVVDCGATPTGLLESELFGHVKGSFTHAIRDKKGLIESADGGTLFLDEIGNISPEMQTRLLRFIEERKIRKIGSLEESDIDCRIISATNADLVEDIQNGKFREDLYYRLRVVTLKVPPLRDRREDIPLLAHRFAQDFCSAHEIDAVKLPSKTVKWLSAYPWPGNVRELKNALEAGIVLCRDGILHKEDIQLGGLPEQGSLPAQEEPDTLSLEDNERQTILRALRRSGGVQKDATSLLGISRRAIHYKIKKYGIDVKNLD